VVQIPDSLRQQLAPVLKHHFWILAGLVPLLLIPALFMAAADRRAVIGRERATIDGQVSALEAVRNTADHPNSAWSEAFDRQAAAVRQELLGEWKAFWESQQPLRVWPEVLGPDFLASIAAVESGSRRELLFRDQQRYQNTVAEIVRQLPARMGCEELMVADEGESGGGPGFGGRRPARPGRPPGIGRPPGVGRGDDAEATQSREVLVWRPEDQKRLFASFTWDKPPSTTKVRLAQEELWVYGLFCDAIRRINEGSTALFDSRITTVDELAVGYLAAEDQPGGQGTGRVIAERQPAGGAGMGEFGDGLPAGEQDFGVPGDKLQGRPPHPRFSGGGDGLEGPGPRGFAPPPGMGEGMEGEQAEASLTPDDMLQQWIYVDFNGRPLTAPELATVPDAQLVHLMPFVLRVVMDQRQIDRLLADLAGNAVPIDVRQVRINPSAQGSGGEGGLGGPRRGGSGPPASGSGRGDRQRPFDVTVELRGTVGLATPPNQAAVGGASDPAAGEGGGDA
jgi:hypothetical protein